MANITKLIIDGQYVLVPSGGSGGGDEVVAKTTSEWNNTPSLVSQAGTIYIYTDYYDDGQGHNVPAFKVGDGLAYLIDLPFVDVNMQRHMSDEAIHITEQERVFWNNKIRTDSTEIERENLIFTTS